MQVKNLVRRPRVISTSLKTTRPARAGVNPTIDRHSVVLPTPLRPSTATTVPAFDGQRHALQHVAVAVVGVEIGTVNIETPVKRHVKLLPHVTHFLILPYFLTSSPPNTPR